MEDRCYCFFYGGGCSLLYYKPVVASYLTSGIVCVDRNTGCYSCCKMLIYSPMYVFEYLLRVRFLKICVSHVVLFPKIILSVVVTGCAS